MWSAEADGADAFTPLALAAAWTPALRLGTAIVPAFTRGPALLAQSVAALAEAAPGRFALGVGTSSDVIVERWNDIPFVNPYKRTRDVVRFLRQALTGEKVTATFDTFSVNGFRLGRPPAVVPPILIAALRPGLLHLAGTEGDGAIINWLSADDVSKVVPEVGAGKEIVARIFVFPTEDRDMVQLVGRRMIAAYLNVPVYAAFHEWLGRGPLLRRCGRRGRPGTARPPSPPSPTRWSTTSCFTAPRPRCRAKIQRYMDHGVTTPALAVVPVGLDLRQLIRDLAPPPSAPSISPCLMW